MYLKTEEKTRRMQTNRAQEREVEVVPGNETRRKLRWIHHKCNTRRQITLTNKETEAEDLHARGCTIHAAHINIGTTKRAAAITRDTTER